MSEPALHELGAARAAEAIREGAISAEALVRACLERIAAEEPRVQAWTFLDPDHALAQAREADAARRRGLPLGALHGVPVGLKDIIDTRDMPTEDGTVLHAGRRPDHDASVVSALRAAGAVILGKTVTTELAVYAPGKTRNPHDPAHTPGGSSSGSAAAVAAGMVPLALGSQTNGSTIRPASFCGVVGFKPSHGLIPRGGVLKQSRALDTVGLFARSIEDVALLADQVAGYDGLDPDAAPRARPQLRQTAAAQPPVPPRLAFVRSPVWEHAEAPTREGFAELVAQLGDRVDEVELGGAFNQVVDWHRTVMESDLALSFAREYASGRDRLSGILCEMIERGQRYTALEYNQALAQVPVLNGLLDEVFDEFDAVLTPAVPGEAPAGLESTGSPIFCTLWTLCGVPAVSLPLLRGENGLPVGVQLVGRRGDDGRLLRTARWLVESLDATSDA